MQRQSIGSPSRASSVAVAVAGVIAATAPEELKPEKPMRPSYSYTTERSVHLIPVLTLLCLLVLYLSSHDLATADAASNGDVASRVIHTNSVAEVGTYAGGGVAGVIVNHRGLKADSKLRNRKLGSDKEQNLRKT